MYSKAWERSTRPKYVAYINENNNIHVLWSRAVLMSRLLVLYPYTNKNYNYLTS